MMNNYLFEAPKENLGEINYALRKLCILLAFLMYKYTLYTLHYMTCYTELTVLCIA